MHRLHEHFHVLHNAQFHKHHTMMCIELIYLQNQLHPTLRTASYQHYGNSASVQPIPEVEDNLIDTHIQNLLHEHYHL